MFGRIYQEFYIEYVIYMYVLKRLLLIIVVIGLFVFIHTIHTESFTDAIASNSATVAAVTAPATAPATATNVDTTFTYAPITNVATSVTSGTNIVASIESKINAVDALFQQLLERPPTASEFKSIALSITNQTLNIGLLKKQIMDSDEYNRIISLQTNGLTPKLQRIISDSQEIGIIAKLYLQVRKQTINPKITLPLKDAYVLMNYNNTEFNRMLSHKNYPYFEQDCLATNGLSRDVMITLYKKYFTDIPISDQLAIGTPMTDAGADTLDGQTDDSGLGVNGGANGSNGSSSGANGSSSGANGLSSGANGASSGANSGANSGTCPPGFDPADVAALKALLRQKQLRDAAANSNSCSNAEVDTSERLYLHTNDMVLRPEFSWSVPQYRPQVCSTLGQPALEVAPLLENSKLLLGTPLQDAESTQVGSIMPKFEFKPYISV